MSSSALAPSEASAAAFTISDTVAPVWTIWAGIGEAAEDAARSPCRRRSAASSLAEMAALWSAGMSSTLAGPGQAAERVELAHQVEIERHIGLHLAVILEIDLRARRAAHRLADAFAALARADCRNWRRTAAPPAAHGRGGAPLGGLRWRCRRVPAPSGSSCTVVSAMSTVRPRASDDREAEQPLAGLADRAPG